MAVDAREYGLAWAYYGEGDTAMIMDTHKKLVNLVMGIFVAAALIMITTSSVAFASETGGDEQKTPPRSVGAAAEQCWEFTIKSDKISTADTGTISGGSVPNCLFSGGGPAVDPPFATFVVCCTKDASGNCKNCASQVALDVVSDNHIVAEKVVKITCKPAPKPGS